MRAAVERLPEGYARIRRIDLMKNKGEMRAVAAISVILMAVMAAGMCACVPFVPAWKQILDNLWASLALLAAIVAYMVLHELVHGLFIRVFSGRRARYGFNWAYAYAGSDFYFARRPYLVIALAPVLFWGAALVALQALVPGYWTWWVFALQIVNVSGAAGDIYTVYVVARLPRDIYVRDSGTAMEIFSRQKGTA